MPAIKKEEDTLDTIKYLNNPHSFKHSVFKKNIGTKNNTHNSKNNQAINKLLDLKSKTENLTKPATLKEKIKYPRII